MLAAIGEQRQLRRLRAAAGDRPWMALTSSSSRIQLSALASVTVPSPAVGAMLVKSATTEASSRLGCEVGPHRCSRCCQNLPAAGIAQAEPQAPSRHSSVLVGKTKGGR
jgi:hypothetical protein